jgi:alanine-synthesizing transaminase
MFADRTNWNLAPNRLSEALGRWRASGQPLIDLTASNPTECGFKYDDQAILGALANSQALTYRPDPKGLLAARSAVAAYYTERGSTVSVEELILTTSTSEAYPFVFRTLCNPGDEILVPEPSYPLFAFLADLQDVKLTRYPLVYDHGWQIDFHSLDHAITPRTRGIIVVNPNNPTGNFVKANERESLNAICRAHEMALIADEVFLDFGLGSETASFVANTGALTFTMSGLSKICGLPQLKLAWLVASGPEKLKEAAVARLEVIADTYLSVSTVAQLAAPSLLNQRHQFQDQLVQRVRQNLAELDNQLRRQKACSRLQIEGGWYAVLRVPAIWSDEDLAIALLETKGVYVHPGHFYDFPTDGYLVVSLIAPKEDFAKGIRHILSIFQNQDVSEKERKRSGA